MMNFEQVLDQKKKNLTEALILFGEGKRVNKVLVDLEKNRPEFYEFYQSGFETGQQSKQEEIDRLNEALKYMLEQLDHPYRSCGERIEKKLILF